MNEEIKKLYSALLDKGYSVNDLGDEKTFSARMSDKNNRKQLYDWVSSKGNFRLGDYDTYEKRLSSDVKPQQEQPASGIDEQKSITAEAPDTIAPPTEQEVAEFNMRMNKMRNSLCETHDATTEKIDNIREYGIGNMGNTVESKRMVNPESGALEKTYLTPAGNRYFDKNLADMESFRYRRAADMSIANQLRQAYKERDRLKKQIENRANEVFKRTSENVKNNLTTLGQALIGGNIIVGSQYGDNENNALKVALRQTEERIKTLEDQKDRENGVDVGFWRGFGRTVKDLRTWDFGMSDFRDAQTMLEADRLIDENATEGEKAAYDEMMGALSRKQQADADYGGNADFWNRAGTMAGNIPAFVVDFAVTGGGFSGFSALGKAGTKTATKVLGKNVIKDMAEQGFKTYVKKNGVRGLGNEATNWLIKATGTTADDLLVRAPLMTNTVQAGKTFSDAVERKLGNVVLNEDGTYDFSNDKTWGSAIWQAEANSIVENFSEMFGAHLDPVMTFGNMSKLANVVGAKRLGGVLAKADAGALDGITGKTREMFSYLGVSDYLGEVSEEYYGQLWRTILNLDDAYQQNADGTRTNLLASGQFHGDIWGGLALSMGLMGAGKTAVTAANYTSLKHNVNKADTKAMELLGKDVWEPLRMSIDLCKNEDIGQFVESIIKDSDFTDDEKATVLNYAERSMNMRGYNLASLAQTRGDDVHPDIEQANQSYLDGYAISSSEEMNDAKNMLEYQKQKLSNLLSESDIEFVNNIGIKLLNNLEEGNNGVWNKEQLDAIRDYLNAQQVYKGMIQRVRDDIDMRVEESNSLIDARVNKVTGSIQGATMKQDDRKVYIISGTVIPFEDGTGIDLTASDESIIVRDAETGDLEQVSPEALLSIDEAQDPIIQKEDAKQSIRQQFAQDAAQKIDGTITYNGGESYAVIDGNGQPATLTVVGDENGIIDNGDGTINVTADGSNIIPIKKDDLQAMVSDAQMGRIATFEQEREAENATLEQLLQENQRPQYALNDLVTIQDENGLPVRGNITAEADADGNFEIYTERPIKGKQINLLSRDELDAILLEHNGDVIKQPSVLQEQTQYQSEEQAVQTVQQEQKSAIERVPTDNNGNLLYEQADADTAWDAIVEQSDGNEKIAQTVADSMLTDKQNALKKLEKSKSKGGNTIAEKIAAEKEHNAAIEKAKEDVEAWKKIAGTASRRKMEADAQLRREREEQDAIATAEKERLLAEQKEAERIKREALNGVPDIVSDIPEDARARGYRRVSGHKIDRQSPVQAHKGKDVSVRFSDSAIENGKVAVIDANKLQPSHIQGVRNPLHFIDEAQPKERSDEASVLSAQKIAENMRPEEITSSATAYTGAPTVNSRGEVIQGNSRSDALKLMWESYKEQSARYRQYLIDHANEFGLNADDIEAVEHPVLVNMLDVEDSDAIRLGQYVAQDTESGGIERIKPKNALQRMGADIRTFTNRLLLSTDDDTSFSGLIDTNGVDVLKWMNNAGYITPTQYQSAFDSKGHITPEAKNDLKGIIYNGIFKGANTNLERMFNMLPAKAQRAILATAYRDYDSPISEQMIEEIQNSIMAYYALSQDAAFIGATNFNDARLAVESWKRQYQMDDVTGDSYLPADNFSNFALHLATMYKGESQSLIQGTFNKLYDLIQGTQEANLFEESDNTPRTLAEAINETLDIDYDGQRRSNLLAGNSTASQQGGQGSNGTSTTGERVEGGEQHAYNSTGVESQSVDGHERTEEVGTEETEQRRLEKEWWKTDKSTVYNGFEYNQYGVCANPHTFLSSRNNSYLSPFIEMETCQHPNGKWAVIWEMHYSSDGVASANNGDLNIRNPYSTAQQSTTYETELQAYNAAVREIAEAIEEKSMADSARAKMRSTLQKLEKFSEGDRKTNDHVGFQQGYDDTFISDTFNGMSSKQLWKAHGESTNAEIINRVHVTTEPRDSKNYKEMYATWQYFLGQRHALWEMYKAKKVEEENDLTDFFDCLNAIDSGDKSVQERYKQRHFKIAPTSIILQRAGLSGAYFTVRYGVLTRHMGKDTSHRLGPDEWKDIILNINSPIAITKYGEDGYRLWTRAKVDGKNVVVGVDVKMSGKEIYVNSITTAFGVDSAKFDAENLVYPNSIKEISPNDLSVLTGHNSHTYPNQGDSFENKGSKNSSTSNNVEEIDAINKAQAETDNAKIILDNAFKNLRSENMTLRIKEVRGAERNVVADYYISPAFNGKDEVFSFDDFVSIFFNGTKWEEEQDNNRDAVNAEHKSNENNVQTDDYTIEQRKDTRDDSELFAVKFEERVGKDEFKGQKAIAKKHGGYWSNFGKKGFLFKTQEAAQAFADEVMGKDTEQVADEAPISLSDVVKEVNVEGLFGDLYSKGETKLSDHAQPVNTYGNKLVTDARYEELKKRMKSKLGQLNAGIDPELLAIGTEMAVYHIEKGARKFVEYANNMIADLGDAIRPYLKAFYNGARELPEMESYVDEMTSYDDVRTINVAEIGKDHVSPMEVAETVVAEQQHIREAKESSETIKSKRNETRHKENERTAADTESIVSEAETIANSKEVGEEAIAKIDETISKIDDQLDKLGIDTLVESRATLVLNDGRKVKILSVVHQGEQIGAGQFSKPWISRIYGYDENKKLVDFAPDKVDVYASRLFNEGLEVSEPIEQPTPNTVSMRPEKWEGLKVGDKVLYKGEPATVYSFEEYGDHKPVLDTGMAPVLYDVANWEDISEITDGQPKKSVKKAKTNKKSVSLQAEETDLFSSLFGTETSEKDELSRNDASRSEGLPADSRGHERGLSSGTESIGKKQEQESRGIERRGENGRSELDRSVQSGPSHSVESPKNRNNNHSERGADHAPATENARIEANIKAIELAKELLENGEKANPAQMKILRKFSGWGGLGSAFNESVFSSTREYSRKLRELLGDEAYEQAVMSANSSYYTPSYVIDTLWDIASKLGFKGGNILEGSAGIGNILGQMPMEISDRSNIQAVEIDSTAGSILSLLYPDAHVGIKGFEQTRIPNGSIDLAITNVPFVTGLHVIDTSGDSDLSKKFRNIHDFCIAKNVRKLRDGGIGIFITSSGTLDSSKKLRDWVINESNSDFIGAFRMNNKTFGGTSVTSDIIVIRKRVNAQKSSQAIDVSDVVGVRTTAIDTGEVKKVKGVYEPVIKTLAMEYNKYFVEHPEMMAGEMFFAAEKDEMYRATSKSLYPVKEKDQKQMLTDFVDAFKAEENTHSSENRRADSRGEYVSDASSEGKKVGEMYVKDGKLVIASLDGYYPIETNDNKVKGHTKAECFEAYADIKTALSDVLKYQTESDDDSGLKPLLAKLNKAYDNFVKTYGHFNKNTAIAFLKNDVDFSSIFALEKFEERADATGQKIQTFGKTDVFTRRVVEKDAEPHPTNVKDGIVASMFKFGRIDIPYIAEQLGVDESKVRNGILESSLGFENPLSTQIEVSYQYLSGNVREKLRQAEGNNTNGKYDANIKALQKVIPMDIPAHLIDFTLGSSWVEPKLYEDYVKERTGITVKFTSVGGTWFMKAPEWGVNTEQNRSMGVISEMLRKTIFGHTLIEAAIQNKTITVSETRKRYDGTTETITDKEATQACSNKIDEIRHDFKDWARGKMQEDAEMSAQMTQVYNDMFNNYVPMSIPDEFVPEYFGGASHKFKMRPHQGRAIVRGTMQPLLLAHEVGTGKTFTLISTAMEMRRLGTARKPMIVVQNATVGQFVASAKELYPNAKILTLEDADRSAEGRRNFYAKIKYNDWDMIVVPQSTFEFIPDSEERRIAFIQSKIDEKMMILEQMKEADPSEKSLIIRQAKKEIEDLNDEIAAIVSGGAVESETSVKKPKKQDAKREAKTRQNARVQAEEMLDRRVDDVENFDEMGIDALLVDEAHEYKHLGFATAMQRGVKGVDPSYSKKSQGVYLKVQSVLEKNNGRNVIFATGTPISNTAAEIWTFMRYLMTKDAMKDYGIYYFDDFVRNFGSITQMLEFSTSGKFKENNRFAGYVNLPELVRIWSGVSDTVLTKEAGGVKDKIPEIEGGKAQDIYLPQTRSLRAIMKFVKEQLDKYDKMSGKEKRENSHIPLTMYGIAKAAAVDARLVQEDADDEPNSKTNEAVRQTLRSLKETESYKGTIAIFADNYQNAASGFNLYEDIRAKLIAEGVPADQIVIIKSGMTVKKKLEIFEKVNRGEIRVIMGSTFTLGTGVNIQERLHTLIHLDAPNRPMDYTQRNGRILRQGNIHKDMDKPIRVLRFGVEDSLDVTAYQRLKTKGAIADSIMNGKQMLADNMTTRVLEEEEDVFGDTVAQLSGSEYAMLKNSAERTVRKYESRKKQWQADQTYIHNAKRIHANDIERVKKAIADNRGYLEIVESTFPNGKVERIDVDGKTFASVKAMEKFLKEHNSSQLAKMKKMKETSTVGEDTEQMVVKFNGLNFIVNTKFKRDIERTASGLVTRVSRKMTYSCAELGLNDIPVNMNMLHSFVEDVMEDIVTGKSFREWIDGGERKLQRTQSELEQILSREGKAFEFDEELEEAKAQLAEYTELMKKELAEKEAKYAQIDAEVKAVEGLSNIEDDENDTMYRIEGSEDNNYDETAFRLRNTKAPTKTGIGYKVFVLKDGQLYPPMVANPNGDGTPVGEWLDAVAAPKAGKSKTGRDQVKAGGKGTQGGSGSLAYRPGWHLGEIPYALQFNRKNVETGERELFPANFVWAEVEYADDIDYQKEAMSYGITESGKFQHSLAGLPKLPVNGSYRYRTNPNPETDPWIITGAMKVNRILTPSEVDSMVKETGREPQRRQNGAITDEQVDALNRSLFAVNDRAGRRNMASHVEKLAEKLHIDNVVDIVMSRSGLEWKKTNAKGFYTKSTGRITIVVPNNTNLADVEKTLLHEAVAHYGLRQMFGDNFDTFLDNVFQNVDENIRRKITAIAAKNGWDFRKATEEYLASLAESTDFENAKKQSWWKKVKQFFANMLRAIGFEDFSGAISDNELRYILWRSYENLTNGRNDNLFAEAKDITMQDKLDITDDMLLRDDTPNAHERVMARQRYEQRVKSGMYQTREALQDSMLGLKEAMDAILKASGEKVGIEDVAGFENAYLGENRLSSVNKAEADAFAQTLFKPMLDEVAKLAHDAVDREELTDYMMAKHGLERNELMAQRDFDAYHKAHPYGNKTIDDFRSRDYAGLTALTGFDDVAQAEKEAEQIVADYESVHDTATLWDKVNTVSNAILSKSYECGMMSKDTFDNISAMYQYYIPLRGFDETTSAEAYAYLGHPQSVFNAPIKTAKGRSSKADDPFANLQSMAESTIMQANRNRLVKQRFINFVLNHPSDLASVSELWVMHDDVADEWKPVFPDNINDDDTAEEVERKMSDFEIKMQNLATAEPDKYKKGKDAESVPYRVVESRDMHQHQIIVKRGGKDYIITINGNPRAAQAVNGLTNPDNELTGAIGAILRAGERINRELSAFYTTRNPDFVVSNFIRDMLYSNSMAWVKESPRYALRFNRNFAAVNPAKMKLLLVKYRKGTLDMSDRTESAFYQFMMNGGETGYANIRDIEKHKNGIRKELDKANGRLKLKKAWDFLADRLDEYNRAVENCARFAAFMTSRDFGRTIDRSIYDAKEISVNFNKKGSGSKFYNAVGQTKSGNMSAMVSGLGRSGYVFWNAAIQGTTNFGRQIKRHPAKAFTNMAVLFLLGAVVAHLGDGDDDDDKNSYYNLPEHIRRSNILFRAGEHWISIPLPVEYRAIYGMGELTTSVLSGKEHKTGGEIADEIMSQASQVLPIDFMEGGGGLNAFVPSSIKPIAEALVFNKNWTGMPVYKDTPYNKDMPEWTKAYKSANRYIVNLAEVMNEVTGGDPYTKGAIDLNPAQVEYLLNGYLGGVFGTIDKMTKTAETIVGAREYDPRSFLIVNRLVKSGDERTEYRAINNEYFRLKEEHDRLKTRLKHYEDDTDKGIFDYAEKIDFLYNSPEYVRYEIFEDYRRDIDALYKELKDAVDDNERKQIEEELHQLKKELINEVNSTRK